MYIYAVVAENHMDLAYGHYVQRIVFEVFIRKTRCEKVEKTFSMELVGRNLLLKSR